MKEATEAKRKIIKKLRKVDWTDNFKRNLNFYFELIDEITDEMSKYPNETVILESLVNMISDYAKLISKLNSDKEEESEVIIDIKEKGEELEDKLCKYIHVED